MSNDLTAYEMVRAGLQRMGAGGSTPGLRRGSLGAQGEKEGHERHHVADNADGERGIRRDAHPISHRHPAYAVTTRPRRQCHLPFRRAPATPPRERLCAACAPRQVSSKTCSIAYIDKVSFEACMGPVAEVMQRTAENIKQSDLVE